MTKASIYKSSGMERICKDMKILHIRILLFIGVFLFFTPSIAGQETDAAQEKSDSLFRHISREMSAEWSCYFTYAQGNGIFSTELGNNAAELEKLDQFIRQALAHPTLFISRIRLTGYSSIEGSYARNEFLARQRVEQFYLYLREYYPELYRYPHDIAWVAEDWGGLSKRIRTSQLKEQEEIQEIIRRVPVFDTREALLMKLNGGRPWLFMERELFPGLRRVELRIEYSTTPIRTAVEPYTPIPTVIFNNPTVPEHNPTVPDHNPESSPQPSPKEREPGHAESDSMTTISDLVSDSISTALNSLSFVENRDKAFHFALKTNLLLLAGVQSDLKYTAPVANIALEYYITDHWSVEASVLYSYWSYNSGREFQGISGYRLEPRYRYAFSGERFEAYLGLYGRSGDFDLRSVDNYTGDYWDAGLSAGLSIRLIGNLALEVGARAGYVSSDPYKYTRDNNYNWFDSRWRYWKVGITDLNLSLFYRF